MYYLPCRHRLHFDSSVGMTVCIRYCVCDMVGPMRSSFQARKVSCS